MDDKVGYSILVTTRSVRLSGVRALYIGIVIAVSVLLTACGSTTTEHEPGEPEAGTPLTTPATLTPPTVEQQATRTQAASTATDCRAGDPLANVYHPARLLVVQPCITVSGRVVLVRKEDDGDLHIRLLPDEQYVALLNDRNRTEQSGALVVEPVPADRPGCTPGKPPRPRSGTYDYGICTGANLAAPIVGQHIAITGPYVLDTAHGWMEVHPLWAWREADASALAPQSTATGNATSSGSTVYYANCAAARAAGVTPLLRQQPGYRAALDRDGDGVACE